MDILNKSLVVYIFKTTESYKLYWQFAIVCIVYQIDVDFIIWRHTRKSELNNLYRVLRHNSRWITERGV